MGSRLTLSSMGGLAAIGAILLFKSGQKKLVHTMQAENSVRVNILRNELI
jgi:hypothetical protein